MNDSSSHVENSFLVVCLSCRPGNVLRGSRPCIHLHCSSNTALTTQHHGGECRGFQAGQYCGWLHLGIRSFDSMGGHQTNESSQVASPKCLHLYGMGGDLSQLVNWYHCLALLGRDTLTKVIPVFIPISPLPLTPKQYTIILFHPFPLGI